MEWENLGDGYRRCRTPEGWILEVYDDCGYVQAALYIPDPLHQWLAHTDSPENVA